jgi:hypothetical protein
LSRAVVEFAEERLVYLLERTVLDLEAGVAPHVVLDRVERLRLPERDLVGLQGTQHVQARVDAA